MSPYDPDGGRNNQSRKDLTPNGKSSQVPSHFLPNSNNRSFNEVPQFSPQTDQRRNVTVVGTYTNL